MKPLNQENYKAKIIEDLGMLPTPGGNLLHKAKFECTSCHEQFITGISSAKKKHLCNTCSHEARVRKYAKPLNQDEYSMKILNDHVPTPSGVSGGRYAEFECTVCEKPFIARAGSAMCKKQLSCGPCTRSDDQFYKHPLYAIWNGIKQRCYSPKRKDYHRYGGIGVTMQPSWVDSSDSFITWCLANGWEEGLVVDKDIKCRELGISPTIYSEDTLSFITTQANAEEANGKETIQLDLEGNYIATFKSGAEAARVLGVYKGAIQVACREGRVVKGFKWKYK